MNFKYYLKFWQDIGKRSEFVTDTVQSLFEVNFKQLKKEGIELLVIDYDDTLTDYHGHLSDDMKTLLSALINQGFKIAIHSNFSQSRLSILIEEFAQWPEIFVQITRDKPFPGSFTQIVDYFDVSSTNSAVIGDRIGTDIYGAYLANFRRRILITPYTHIFGGAKTDIPSQILRAIEKKICGIS